MFTRPAFPARFFWFVGICLLWASLPGQAAPVQDPSAPAPDRPKAPRPPGEILHVEGTITEKDQFDGQKFARVHQVVLQAGKTYLFDMISQEKNPKEFDPFLMLKDPEGKVVASGGFPNARILYKPAVAGTYQVIATTFAGNMAGKYLLIVREAPPGLAAVEAIKQDLLKSLQTLQKDFFRAKDQKDRAQVIGRLFQTLKDQGERLLAVAQKYGKEEPLTNSEVELLLRQMSQLMQQLSSVLSSTPAPAATTAVRDLRKQIPYPLVKGEFTLLLASLLRQDYERAYQEKDPRAAAAFYEEAHELLQKLAKDKAAGSKLPQYMQQSWDLLTRQAEDALFLLEHLSVGKPAPELEGEDLAGNKLKLSAYRGKVVVLDFWAFWCPHCVKMLPHERQLVQRLSKRPFVLLGINADRDREATQKRLEKEEITWPNFWDSGGKLSQQYRVSYLPTIYVLDARGIIRYRDVRGEELEQAVETLLREVERPSP
jgi:thiol-disulfide isomerase/thioredoxin